MVGVMVGVRIRVWFRVMVGLGVRVWFGVMVGVRVRIGTVALMAQFLSFSNDFRFIYCNAFHFQWHI